VHAGDGVQDRRFGGNEGFGEGGRTCAAGVTASDLARFCHEWSRGWRAFVTRRVPRCTMTYFASWRPADKIGSVRQRAGSAGMDGRTPAEERELVQALMLLGWYRDGREPPGSPYGGLWRFRAGHSLETPRRPTILARAPDQQSAMRAVLAWLRQNDDTWLGAATGDASQPMARPIVRPSEE
jgi:hypothetical protein